LERPPPHGARDCPYREAMELAPTDAERRYLAERLRELDLAT
jgi:predicted RNA polymerase sigma factor